MHLSALIACVAAGSALVSGVPFQTPKSKTTTTSIYKQARKYSFALVSPDGNVSCFGTWQGEELRNLRDRSKETTMYVRKDNQMYVIADKAIVEKSRAAIEPMNELGRQQGELGKQQSKLGMEQAHFGEKMAVLGEKMAELSRELARSTGAQGGVDEKLIGEMKELGRQQKELGKQQAALGDRQKELGKKQSELGKKQSALAKEADEKITKLIDDAFARGLPQKVVAS